MNVVTDQFVSLRGCLQTHKAGSMLPCQHHAKFPTTSGSSLNPSFRLPPHPRERARRLADDNAQHADHFALARSAEQPHSQCRLSEVRRELLVLTDFVGGNAKSLKNQ
jgi:hypothetical protein